MGYKILEHTADFGLRVRGRDFVDLIHNATLALVEVWFGKAEIPVGDIVRKVQINGVNKERVLVKYLNEIIFLIDSQRLIPADVKCILNETHDNVKLRCTIEGADIGKAGLTAIRPIKAATYHQLSIQRTPRGLIADIFFDI